MFRKSLFFALVLVLVTSTGYAQYGVNYLRPMKFSQAEERVDYTHNQDALAILKDSLARLEAQIGALDLEIQDLTIVSALNQDREQRGAMESKLQLLKEDRQKKALELVKLQALQNKINYLSDSLTFFNPGGAPGKTMAFFEVLDDDRVLKGLGSSGVYLSPNSGIVGLTTGLSTMYILGGRINVLAQVTNSSDAVDSVAKADVAAQQIIGGGGNLVVQYLFPLGYKIGPKAGFRWLVDFRNGLQLPALGETTSQISYVGDLGLDLTGYLRDESNKVAAYLQARISMIAGGNALEANLGLDNAKAFPLFQGTAGVQLFQPVQLQAKWFFSPREDVREAFPLFSMGLVLTPEFLQK